MRKLIINKKVITWSARSVFFLFVAAIFFCSFLEISHASADINYYYVDNSNPQAGDNNSGTSSKPWKTIRHATTKLLPGDVCFVKKGTYNENVTIAKSGSPDRFITYKAIGKVQMKGFKVEANYIRIMGFNIDSSSGDGIMLNPGNNCEVWDNYIRGTKGFGIHLVRQGQGRLPHHVLIKSNTLAYCWGRKGIQLQGDNCLVEYNDIKYQDDSFNLWGKLNIIRNNHIHDCSEKYFPGTHNDIVQTFSNFDPTILLNKACIENNFISDNRGPDAHCLMARDPNKRGSKDINFRFNIVKNIGSWTIHIFDIPDIRIFNNIFTHVIKDQPKCACISYKAKAINGKVINNIFYDCPELGGTQSNYRLDNDCKTGFHADYNLTYRAGREMSEPNVLNNVNPLLVDPNNNDYHFKKNSPCIGTGGNLTKTVNSGTNQNIIKVEEAGFFHDGWEMTRGDEIRIGDNNPVIITNIDYAANTITVDCDMSWKANDKVYLTYNGRSPNRGPYNYKSNGNHDFEIAIKAPVNNALLGMGKITISADVTNKDEIAHVAFFVDGVPIAIDYTYPFWYKWDNTKYPIGEHTIETRAYTRYPALFDNMVERDEIQVITTDTILDIETGYNKKSVTDFLFANRTGKGIVVSFIPKVSEIINLALYNTLGKKVYSKRSAVYKGRVNRFSWDSSITSNGSKSTGFFIVTMKGENINVSKKCYIVL